MDRRALKREYKETPRPMGVYRVRNLVNGRALIGASKDLPAALNRQRAQLNMGAHPSRALQQDWKDLGADAFALEVLDTLTPREDPDYDPSDDLQALEELWSERIKPTGYK